MSARRGRLWVVWAALAVLIAVIVFVTGREGTEEGDGHGHEASKSRMLLPAAVDELGAMEIAYEGALHRFERGASGAWYYHGPHAASAALHEHLVLDVALSERIGKTFSGLDKARMEREAPYEKERDLFGVAVPKIILLVYRPKESQPLAQYAFGDIAPDTHSRYVHLVGTNRVVTLPEYHVENLLSVIRMVASAPLTAQPAAPK